MRVLVLYAHPLEDSFAAAIHAEVLGGLREAGHEVDDCDLYAEGFDPVLSAEERRHYHDETRNRLTVADYVARLQRAEPLVLCYPVWCFNLPAILKGWCDRVLLPGVSFRLEAGVAKPALTQIRAILGVCTYGRPWWTGLLIGDPAKKMVTRYLRLLTGWRAKARYLALRDMNRATDADRRAFLERARMAAARL